VSLLEAHPLGVVLNVKAHAGARTTGIRGVQAECLQVSVTQAPEKGKANKTIIGVLAEALALKKSQIELLSGDTSPRKRFLLRDVEQIALQARIDALIAE
jgi:uncharacterized protein (TIGR00251 family)